LSGLSENLGSGPTQDASDPQTLPQDKTSCSKRPSRNFQGGFSGQLGVTGQGTADSHASGGAAGATTNKRVLRGRGSSSPARRLLPRSGGKWAQLKQAVEHVQVSHKAVSPRDPVGAASSSGGAAETGDPWTPRGAQSASASRNLQRWQSAERHVSNARSAQLSDLGRRFAFSQTGGVRKEAAPPRRDAHLTLEQFGVFMATFSVTDEQVVRHLFRVVGAQRRGAVLWEEVADLVGTLRWGSDEAAARCLFSVYQFDSPVHQVTLTNVQRLLRAAPGVSDSEDVHRMVTTIWDMIDSNGKGWLNHDQWVRELVARPLVLQFFNRWFVDKVLKREDDGQRVVKKYSHATKTPAYSGVVNWTSMHDSVVSEEVRSGQQESKGQTSLSATFLRHTARHSTDNNDTHPKVHTRFSCEDNTRPSYRSIQASSVTPRARLAASQQPSSLTMIRTSRHHSLAVSKH